MFLSSREFHLVSVLPPVEALSRDIPLERPSIAESRANGPKRYRSLAGGERVFLANEAESQRE